MLASDDLPFPHHASFVDGALRTVFTIRCCHAGCDHSLEVVRPAYMRSGQIGVIAAKAVNKALKEYGWTTKSGFRRPTCPDHQHKNRPITEDDKVAITAEIAQQEAVVSKQAEPIRVPTLTQRRNILEQLEMVYDVNKGCYNKGHSDSALAKAGNYPRKWVSDIREQFFGINDKSEDYTEALAQIEKLNVALSASEAKIFAELEKVQDLQKQLKQLATNLTK